MIIAAFEWELRRVYPDGIPRDEKKKQIEEKATEETNIVFDIVQRQEEYDA